jgi:RNA polymerase sigma-70 factor (ECF subfamily)
VTVPDAISDVALAGLYRGRAAGVLPALTDAALGAALRALFEEGRRAWPGVALGIEAFVAHLADRVGADLPSAARAPDLYLACACATRVRGAVEAFDRTYLAGVGANLGRLGPTSSFVDEVRQEVRHKLFVGKDGSLPKIVEYDGKGALASWVKVVAIRAGVDLRRRSGAVAADVDGTPDSVAVGNPETEYQGEHYRKAFDEAIRGAVAALDRDQRRLLRRHFAEGITLEALAVELGVHRATVARRLAAARSALREEARRRLHAALGAGDSELTSLDRMMRSRLDLSLPSLLRTG